MSDDTQGILDTLRHAGELKRLRRQGWIDRGVPEPESVADHSYRMAIMVLLLGAGDQEIDLARALTLALVHDLPEALAGDVTPFDAQLAEPGANRDELFQRRPAYSEEAKRVKHAAEETAIRRITAGLPADLAQLIVGAWREYEAGETTEAKLVHQIDKLETWLQATEYQAANPALIIESFRLGTEEAVTDPRLRELLDVIRKDVTT